MAEKLAAMEQELDAAKVEARAAKVKLNLSEAERERLEESDIALHGARREVKALQGKLQAVEVPPPTHTLPYKVDTSRPSLRTNWTRLQGKLQAVERERDGAREAAAAAVERGDGVHGALGGREEMASQLREELAAARAESVRLAEAAEEGRGRLQAAEVPPPPPSRTKWTRLVHLSVLTGHLSCPGTGAGCGGPRECGGGGGGGGGGQGEGAGGGRHGAARAAGGSGGGSGEAGEAAARVGGRCRRRGSAGGGRGGAGQGGPGEIGGGGEACGSAGGRGGGSGGGGGRGQRVARQGV